MFAEMETKEVRVKIYPKDCEKHLVEFVVCRLSFVT